MSWKLSYTKQALKDAKKIKASHLEKRVKPLLDILANDPLQTPPFYEKLIGDLEGLYSRRINIQHRLVYQIYPHKRTVRIIRMWTH